MVTKITKKNGNSNSIVKNGIRRKTKTIKKIKRNKCKKSQKSKKNKKNIKSIKSIKSQKAKKLKGRINKQYGGNGTSGKKLGSSLQTLLLGNIYKVLKQARQISGLYYSICGLLDSTNIESLNFTMIPKAQTLPANNDFDLTIPIKMSQLINKNTALFGFSSIYWKLLCLDFIYTDNQYSSNQSRNESNTDNKPSDSSQVKSQLEIVLKEIVNRHMDLSTTSGDKWDIFLRKYSVTFDPRTLNFSKAETDVVSNTCAGSLLIYNKLKGETITRSHRSITDMSNDNLYTQNSRPAVQQYYSVLNKSRSTPGGITYHIPFAKNDQGLYQDVDPRNMDQTVYFDVSPPLPTTYSNGDYSGVVVPPLGPRRRHPPSPEASSDYEVVVDTIRTAQSKERNKGPISINGNDITAKFEFSITEDTTSNPKELYEFTYSLNGSIDDIKNNFLTNLHQCFVNNKIRFSDKIVEFYSWFKKHIRDMNSVSNSISSKFSESVLIYIRQLEKFYHTDLIRELNYRLYIPVNIEGKKYNFYFDYSLSILTPAEEHLPIFIQSLKSFFEENKLKLMQTNLNMKSVIEQVIGYLSRYKDTIFKDLYNSLSTQIPKFLENQATYSQLQRGDSSKPANVAYNSLSKFFPSGIPRYPPNLSSAMIKALSSVLAYNEKRLADIHSNSSSEAASNASDVSYVSSEYSIHPTGNLPSGSYELHQPMRDVPASGSLHNGPYYALPDEAPNADPLYERVGGSGGVGNWGRGPTYGQANTASRSGENP